MKHSIMGRISRKKESCDRRSADNCNNTSIASDGGDYMEIAAILRRAKLYIKLNKMWHYAIAAFVCGLAVVLAIETLFRLVIFDNRRVFEISSIVLLLACALFWPLFRRISNLQAARILDAKFGAKERVATAVELQESSLNRNSSTNLDPNRGLDTHGIDMEAAVNSSTMKGFRMVGSTTNFKNKVIADAAGVCATIRLGEGFSYRPPNRILAVIAALLFANAALFFVPNPGELVLAESKAFAKQLESEKAALAKKRDEIARSKNLSKKDKEELLKKIDDLLKELSARKLTKEETVAKLAGFEQELEKKQPDWGESSNEMLQRLARKMPGNPEFEKLSLALQERDFRKAADEAKNLSKLSNLSEADRQRLASSMNKMAESAAPVDAKLAKALEKLASALQNGGTNSNSTASSANQLSDALEQSGQQASLEQIASALSDQLAQSRLALTQSDQQGQQSPALVGKRNNQGNAGSQGNQGSQSGSAGGGGSIGARTSARSGNSPANRDFGDIQLDRERQTGKYDSVYAPELIDAKTRDERLSGTKNQGEETFESVSLPPSREEALIPYEQAYFHYYDTAVEALNKGEIPVGMENAVKNYFSAVQPDK